MLWRTTTVEPRRLLLPPSRRVLFQAGTPWTPRFPPRPSQSCLVIPLSPSAPRGRTGQGGLRSVRGDGHSVQYGVGLRPSFTLEAGTSHTLEAYSIYQVPWELSRILNWLTLHFFRSVAVVLCLDRRHIELVVFTAAGLSSRAASTRCCLHVAACCLEPQKLRRSFRACTAECAASSAPVNARSLLC